MTADVAGPWTTPNRTMPRPADPALVGTTGAREGAVGFLTDTTLCIGCKACEVACKQWNQLPMDNLGWTGQSYDNTGDLGAATWRHVAFVERLESVAETEPGRRPTVLKPFQSNWLMASDVCKHCVNAGCLEACPTGAIIRTEFDTVVVQEDVCNGCGYCVPACPYGVVEVAEQGDGLAHKCTLCYDRLKDDLQPACAKACPTDSIVFGPIPDLMAKAQERVASLRERGVDEAYIYGDRATGGTGGMEGNNAFFILTAPPEVYNLPRRPTLPQEKTLPSFLSTVAAALAFGAAAFLTLRQR